ncbi:MAG: secretin N-terminal domain-containing protein [Candidatus Omnitrophota bacterium]
MKNIIGGIRGFTVFLCVICFVFYPNLNYAQDEQRLISMDFQQAALKDVLKIFSQQAGLNFVATREIENKQLTLYLDGVTVQDALDSIIDANNLTYEQKPNSSVFIVKEATTPRIKMVTKVYNLNYAKVNTGTGGAGSQQGGDIKSIMEKLLAKDSGGKTFGEVLIDQRTNSLIVTSVPSDFSLIEATLAKLDMRTPQVMIEAEIIEVNTQAIKNLGLDWGSTTEGNFFSFTGPTRDTGFPFVRENGILSRSLLGSSLADTRGRTLATSATGNTFGNLSLAEFQVVLKALETTDDAEYLAKPKIMVVNNETAEIKISANSAIGTTTTSQTDTGTVSSAAERVETGVLLRVTPTVNKDDYITMTLEPEVSRVIDSNVTGFFDPAKRSAKTTVMMKNGQTIAIGGLLKKDDVANERAVPGLSKIPLLGNMFKSHEKDNTITEIIIFVTAHVIKIDQQAQGIGLAQAQDATIEQEAAVTERDEEISKAVQKLRKKREIE